MFLSTYNISFSFFKNQIYFSDSPTYLEVISADETEKNVASASVAQAFAKYVLPVPGG